jgi:hypothetical protein
MSGAHTPQLFLTEEAHWFSNVEGASHPTLYGPHVRYLQVFQLCAIFLYWNDLRSTMLLAPLLLLKMHVVLDVLNGTMHVLQHCK